KRSGVGRGEKEDELAGRFTRRTVLTGAAAATAAISVGAVDSPASAQARQDMVNFVLLSGALTGIAELKLAPGFDLAKSEPGSDPVDGKQEYFDWGNKRRPGALKRLLQIAADSQKLPAADRAQAITEKVQATTVQRHLAG